MTDFEISQISEGRYRLRGELDMASAPTMHDALEPIVRAHGSLALDVAELTFIDSSGLRALVLLSERMNGSAPLVISNVSPSVKRLLDIVGLEALPGIKVEGDG